MLQLGHARELSLQEWVASRIKKIAPDLDFDLSPIVETALSFSTNDERENFLREFLGNSSGVKGFLHELRGRLKKLAPPPVREIAPPQDAVLLKRDEKLDDQSGKKKKKKLKQMRKNTSSGPGVMAPGRLPCSCMATSHKLVRNCLQCGKIICEQEGEGPCLFCSEQDDPDAYEGAAIAKAIEHKNKLIDYERSSARRTVVYDDSNDYWSTQSDVWLSEDDRKRAREEHQRAMDEADRQKRT
eukprot:CAMPEP_0177661780 /NCGR_PEP_ID=MMETSP0447-20121125/18893_1 /TAXON_ID=0 /ORGANISM="Stygamoeba regulata, Strain BSH-02190019" /LENGTH=241 /DNA_ID=CAMNT_0019167209 /DNA_START=209 /DNA_END=931 /DNA_ORIENTATION=+